MLAFFLFRHRLSKCQRLIQGLFPTSHVCFTKRDYRGACSEFQKANFFSSRLSYPLWFREPPRNWRYSGWPPSVGLKVCIICLQLCLKALALHDCTTQLQSERYITLDILRYLRPRAQVNRRKCKFFFKDLFEALIYLEPSALTFLIQSRRCKYYQTNCIALARDRHNARCRGWWGGKKLKICGKHSM